MVREMPPKTLSSVEAGTMGSCELHFSLCHKKYCSKYCGLLKCLPSSDGRYQQRRSVHCVDDHTLNPLSDRDCTSRNNPKPEEHRACMRIRIRRHKGSYVREYSYQDI